ncbi:MAG: baseplate J/gp47 family protein [Deltaproteobacteria bacterium]|nr:baseplate J/gp47 family protein [Myxococcales bacterium]MDP3217710.1 baseplate J/gp47 family protein [Deltaproteobacteria bacterium]
MTDPRDAETIAERFLTTLQGEHAAIGQRVVTTPKSPYGLLGLAIGLECEGAEFMAAASRNEAFPDTASEAGVLRHATLNGIERIAASRASLRVRITGTPSATLTVPADKTMTDAVGLVYLATPGNVVTDSGGFGFVVVTARDPGSEQNLPSNATLTWQNGAPTGMAATGITLPQGAETTHVLVTGADAETIEELRGRVVSYFREPSKGAGTRSDYALNAEAVEGVGGAFVYPRALATYGADGGAPHFTWAYNTPGTLAILLVTPAPPATSYVQDDGGGALGVGLRPATTRIPSSTLLARVGGYIEGTNDAAGRAVPSSAQVQRRPAGMGPGNYRVLAPIPAVTEVIVRLTIDPSVCPWPWGTNSGSARAIQASPAPTTTTFTLDETTDITQGSRIAVFVGANVIKGGWWLSTVASVVGNAVTISTAAPFAPTAGAQMLRPDCGLWHDARRLIFAEINTHGPGDIPLNVEPEELGSQRYPRPNDRGSDRLFQSDIVALLEDLPGVLGVTVDSPASDVVSPPGTLTVPGVFTIKIGS